MTHKKIGKLLTFFSVIALCFVPFVFSSGCMFDPGTVTTISDSTTYKVTGKVYTPDSKGVAGIQVSLFDSVNSIRSTVSVTDTNGSFSISFPYIKQDFLQIDFFIPNSLSTVYSNKRDTIRFDDNYFKYNLTKYHETTLSSK